MFWILVLIFLLLLIMAGSNVVEIARTKEEFIQKVMPLVLKHDVDPKAVIAVSALETNWGKRVIGGTNLFNIKGPGAEVLTTEYKNGIPIKTYASFKVYPSLQDSVDDFIKLIQRRYPEAWKKRKKPYEFFYELWKGGYATDPKYYEKLKKVYESI